MENVTYDISQAAADAFDVSTEFNSSDSGNCTRHGQHALRLSLPRRGIIRGSGRGHPSRCVVVPSLCVARSHSQNPKQSPERESCFEHKDLHQFGLSRPGSISDWLRGDFTRSCSHHSRPVKFGFHVSTHSTGLVSRSSHSRECTR